MCTQLTPSDEPQLCERCGMTLAHVAGPSAGEHSLTCVRCDDDDDDGVASSGACPVDAIDAMS